MSGFFDYFWTFVGSVGSHTVTLFAGCVFTVVLGLIEKYGFKRRLSVKADIAVLLLFLFFACFQAWQDQYRTAKNLQAQMDSQSQPDLIPWLGEGVAPSMKNASDSLITFSGEIKDKGAPTVLDHWGVTVSFPDGKKTTGDVLHTEPNDTVTLYGPHGEKQTTLYGSHDFILSAAATPIPHNGSVTGWISARIVGLSANEILDKKATLTLSCEDINGKRWYFSAQVDRDKETRFVTPQDMMVPLESK
jgi:hypothetical protein